MSIYEQIASNKRKTYLTMALFVIFIALISWVFGEATGNGSSLIGIALLFSAVISFSSYWWSDKAVLAMTGAHPADPRIHFDFYTTAENISIASGMPKPKLYVIDDLSPNAFATGRDPEHAAVVVTTGILRLLDRAELEGVIAHELSHIQNFDIRLMAIITVLVGTVAFIADMFTRNLWWGSDRKNNNKSGGVILIVGVILALLSPIVASLIKLSISRKREFLADATSAHLTRNPKALASALEKISADPHITKSASHATAHLFISSPFKQESAKQWVASLFNTHPPIAERVRILRAM